MRCSAAARFFSWALNTSLAIVAKWSCVNLTVGLLYSMPTVLRERGFRVVIFLPPREHAPPHVHVQKLSGEVVIELADGDRPQTIRNVVGLRTREITAAFWLVEEHSEHLMASWRKYHG